MTTTLFDVPDRRQHLRDIATILDVLICRLIVEGQIERRDKWGWNEHGEWIRGGEL